MKKLLFAVGCQDLYGEEVIKKVTDDGKRIGAFLDGRIKDVVSIEFRSTILSSDQVVRLMNEANADEDCVGLILWMHTFSPAKMWIKGLQILHKPLLHLHTQSNERIPYSDIDMDFMNLNQSAHGDREFAFILKRLGIKHKTVCGFYQHESVVSEIREFAEVALAIDYSKNLNAACFGNNMREVAVTDGDRVQSQIDFGWEANYYGIGDLVDLISQTTESETDAKLKEYSLKYQFSTDRLESVREQAKYDVALHKFIKKNHISAFTDTFQDLHGLRQLPGLAVQNLMGEGIGFGPEGDYKTACLSAVLMKMSEKRDGGTGFIEDYTYDLTQNQELELGSHMLEVSPKLASDKPRIEVHPLSIGGKEAPARLVFNGIQGKGIQVTMIDLGSSFRLIAMEIELIKAKDMPKLPVARLMWKILPSFREGTEFWLENGGGHHSVISNCLTLDDIRLFAKLTNTDLVVLPSNLKN
ncbi:MAG: L-arabinose isomerase [Bacilli bacterium]|jgi:L-arabinose isomerase|nr:L-arabinose isomerase [Bacilli bacterium]